MGSTHMRGDHIILGSSYLRVLLYYILAVCCTIATCFFTVTIITELLSALSISVVFLSIRLSFLLLIWNRKTVDIFLYDINFFLLPTPTSEAKCYNACYGICDTVLFHLLALFPGPSSACFDGSK